VLFDRIGRIFDDHDLLITPGLAVVLFPGEQRFSPRSSAKHGPPASIECS
jgi:hypothetical protein